MKMYSQQIRRNHNVSVRSILNDFLARINYNRIYLPYNSNAQIIAAHMRSGKIIQEPTGMDLMEQNVRREANRLNLRSQHIIRLATNRIWNFSTIFQKDQFTTLANDVNDINQNLSINNTYTLVDR